MTSVIGDPIQHLKEMGYFWIKSDIGILLVKLSEKEFFNYKELKFLKFIRRELEKVNLNWLYVLTEDNIIVFSLFNDNYLLWNAIPKNISILFLYTILVNPELQNQINEDFLLEAYRQDFNVYTTVLEEVKDKKRSVENENLHKSQLPELNSICSFFAFKSQVLLRFEEITYNFHTDSTNQDIIRFLNKLVNKPLFEEESSVKMIDFLCLTPIYMLENPPLDLNIDKMRGQYFTPLELAFTLVDHSFNSLSEKKKQSLSNILKLKILDPASGTGMILFVALERVANHIIQLDEKIPFNSIFDLREKVFFSCFNAFDIDDRVVNFSRDFCRFFMSLPEIIPEKAWMIMNQNFLTFMTDTINNPKLQRKFDIILSNPPYIPFSGRFAKKVISEDVRNLLLKMIPKFMGKRENLYIMFLGLALRHASSLEHGIVGFIIDHSFLDLGSYCDIRKVIIEDFTLKYMLESYSYRKAVVDLSIIIFQNLKPQDKEPIEYYGQKGLKHAPKFEPTFHFNDHPNYIYKTYRKEASRGIINQISEDTVNLGDISKVSCGLEYGSLLKSHFLFQNQSQDMYPVLDGSNGIPQSFVIFWVPEMDNSYVKYSKEYEEYLKKNNLNRSIMGNKEVLLISGEKERFTEPKIFLRQTANKFIISYDTEGFFGLRNLHTIHNFQAPFSPYLIMGILTSKFGNWLGKELNIIRSTGTNGNRYPQIRIRDMNNFPIIDIEKESKNTNPQRIKQLETKTRENIQIGSKITTVYRKIWSLTLSQTDKKPFSSQKRLFHFCKNPEKFSFFSKQAQRDLSILLNDLTRNEKLIQHNQMIIDQIIFKMYGIAKEDWERIL